MIELPRQPVVSAERRSRLNNLLESTKRHPPADLAQIILDELRIDLSTRYGGAPVPHPFGKGSGQLSFRIGQVEADVEAGVAFIVLKTVIAEDAAGNRSMDEWALPEARMSVERRPSTGGRVGWTVTWKGRGWADSLDDYLDFFAQAQSLGNDRDIPVVPSVKYHLPGGEEPFRIEEYHHTTTQLLGVWDRVGCSGQMLLEKDLSPTLAGDSRSQNREIILSWLETIPGLLEQSAPGRVRLGVKVMNTLFDDAFQVETVKTLVNETDPTPGFLVVFNRLFDPDRQVAYGGWELSDRNLAVLDALRESRVKLPPLSGTGNICSGKMMVEYALRGCENGQVHTFFQLPLGEYTATGGSRSARAVHTLLLHPEEGLVVWLWHLNEKGELPERDGVVHFQDLVERARA